MRRKAGLWLTFLCSLGFGACSHGGAPNSVDNVEACQNLVDSLECGSFKPSNAVKCSTYKSMNCDLSDYFDCLAGSFECVNGAADITGWSACTSKAVCNGSVDGGASGGSSYSCDQTTGGMHICTLFSFDSSVPASVITQAKAGCSQGGGSAVNSCSKTNLLGTCAYQISSGTYSTSVTANYYDNGYITADIAEQACNAAQNATWTPAD